ncbi:MAG: RNA polymerase sigma factor [Planctomycetota bacterium]|nr:RNA polymerase sigma factor [Planctomycetota bacterium]
MFEAHKEAVYRYLYRLSRNRHDAEDLLQETFARFWRKRAQFRGDGSLGGYLRRIAYRTFLNARPRLAKARHAPLDGLDPSDGRADPAARSAADELDRFLLLHVRAAVDALPDSWREPFVLFRFEGLTMKQIAADLDMTPKAVEMRVTRALQRITDQLRDLRTRFGAGGAA